MRKCVNPKCKNTIPNRMWLDGKMRVLCKRKLCIQCSPFGAHNTKAFGYVRMTDSGRACPVCNKPYQNKGVFCGSCLSNLRRFKIKDKALTYLGGKCVKCGYDKCPASLHFHHKDDTTKKFGISGAYTLSWERIKSELNKCEILCANCHAEKHWDEADDLRVKILTRYNDLVNAGEKPA